MSNLDKTQQSAVAVSSQGSEHPVVVGRDVGDHLEDVPVLDDPAVVVEAEDVDSGVVVVAGPTLVAVQHDQVAFGDGALELDVLAGVLRRHPVEAVDEGLLAIGDLGVVLAVLRPCVALDGLGRTALG